jgi:thiazole synthase ThiGH ThiG subunit
VLGKIVYLSGLITSNKFGSLLSCPAGKTYNSRLLVGSGKYQDLTETKLATEAAEAEIITVAIRRTNIGQDKSEPNELLNTRLSIANNYVIER